MSSRAVIVGGSVGGVRTAQALRSNGYAGQVIVIDAEPHLPYDKPPLSKGFLDNSLGLDRLHLISKKEVEESKIDLLLGAKAVGLDLQNGLVSLEGGAQIGYDNLIISTGVRARQSPWEVSDGVYLLRTLDDALGLKEKMTKSHSVVIVGGGFIGAEVAATARKYGLDVAIVDPLEFPIGRVLGDEVGERFVGLHHENGVSTHFGIGVESISRESNGLVVGLSDGSKLIADFAIVGIGAVPNVEWLASSGLVLDNGVVCDEFCRAVGQANVYGVGDVARWYHARLGELVRVEHWTNAVEQAECVARNILNDGDPQSYVPVPYVWSDQYNWKIQIAGVTSSSGEVVVIEDPSRAGRFAALYADSSGAYRGVATVNWPKAMIRCRRMLETRQDLSVPVQLVREMVSGT